MSRAHILVHQISFNLPTGLTLFTKLSLSFSNKKTGLVGKNGIGKSTLLKLILKEHAIHSGSIDIEGTLAYIPQKTIISPETTIARLLGYEEKLLALQRISDGSVSETDFSILNEEWDIAERLQKQLDAFGLSDIPPDRRLDKLSGGELTRLLLSQAFFSNADFLLLDEPTNHLDSHARQQLYTAIQQWNGGLIVVSHDRALLNLMEEIIELDALGAHSYGGNYDHYVEQKNIEKIAKEKQLHDAKKLTQKTKSTIQESYEKHAQKQSQGRKLRRSGSIDKLTANSKKGRSERTQSKMLIKAERLTHQAETELQLAKEKIAITEEIHVELPATNVPNGKIMLEIEDLNFSYQNASHPIIQNFNLSLQGPERIALVGNNGSGKTTLIKLILKELQPTSGKIYIGTTHVSYLDQNADLLNPDLSVLENFMSLNPDAKESNARLYLAQFLFKNVSALKLVKNISGGEKLRALLACVLMSSNPPQLLILDEPTNHLDLTSIRRIESALNNYQGAMIVISHDTHFLKNIGVARIIETPFRKTNSSL